MTRLYQYVGSRGILERTKGHPVGTPIQCEADLARYVMASGRKELTVTYTLDLNGRLRVADRHSEHVACAGNVPVMGAGEMTVELFGEAAEILYITNQSTGYCPEKSSWNAIQAAMSGAGIDHPNAFTTAYEFRRCDACTAINIVKDGWLVCSCGADLPKEWNFA